MYMYCEIFTRGTPEYSDVVYVALNSQSFMSACMTLWMCVLFTYQNISMMLKI